jgi:hypothetical protein
MIVVAVFVSVTVYSHTGISVITKGGIFNVVVWTICVQPVDVGQATSSEVGYGGT